MGKSKEACQDIRKRNVPLSERSRKRQVLCPIEDRVLVRNVQMDSRNVRGLVKMLAEAGKTLSLSGVKHILF